MRNSNKITYSSKSSHAARKAHKQAKHKYPTYDTSAIRPKKNKSSIVIVVIVAVVLLAIAGFIAYSVISCNSLLPAGQTTEVEIAEGASANEIANELVSAKLIRTQAEFKVALENQGAGSDLKSGIYVLEGGKSCDEYVSMLVDGPDSSSPKIVVYEGMRLNDICSCVDKATKGRISYDDFKAATSDSSKYANEYQFLKEAKNNSLEGFLFPMSYVASSADNATDIVKKMLDCYKSETKDLTYSYPNSCGLNSYDVLILASIIEKESSAETRKKVASVFYNRLNNNIQLNSDATTAYEVGHDPSPEEIHKDSPYSTYTNYGLCPTPICSPGLDALQAACNPDQTDYYYFYFKTDNDGQTKYAFSKTYDEHQQNIANL